MPIASWSLVRVYGTWVNHEGALLAGNVKIKVPTRLTNSADDQMIPAGIFANVPLNTTAGLPSLSIPCPATDDPDIQQDGWKLEVEVTFTGGQASEKFTIDVPVAARPIPDGGTGEGVNLRTIALTSQLPPQVAMYGVGTPGGLATLSEDGLSVMDANGNPITGGGGGGPTDWDDITDKPAVIAAGATAADARSAIGAGTSSLAIGTTSGTAAAGNDGRFASSLVRGNHTGTQTAATISDLTEVVQDIVGALIVAGTNVTVNYDDGANTFTINSTGGGGGSTDPEIVRDTIGGALVAGSGVQVTVNDAGDTITIASTAVLPTRQVATGNGLTGGGDLSSNRTLAVDFGTGATQVAAGNHTHAAADVTSGNLAVGRNTASVPHDVWQASGGTWPSRPAVPPGARVNWIGSPGLTDLPAEFVTGTDSYMPRTT